MGVKLLGINPRGIYIGRTIDFVQINDIFTGLTKSLMFGLITTLVACYYGFYTTGEPRGVGKGRDKLGSALKRPDTCVGLSYVVNDGIRP